MTAPPSPVVAVIVTTSVATAVVINVVCLCVDLAQLLSLAAFFQLEG